MGAMARNEEKFKDTDIDIAAISALIIGGIYYLNLHRDRSLFSGIDIKKESGLKRIEDAIVMMGHMIYQYKESKDLKLIIAERFKKEGISQDIIDKCIF